MNGKLVNIYDKFFVEKCINLEIYILMP